MYSNNFKDDFEVQLPFGAPPVMPDVEKQLEEYITSPERLPIHSCETAQRFWPRTTTPSSLYHYGSAPLATTLKVVRNPTTGEILRFQEVTQKGIGCTVQNSMSLTRAPGPQEEVRGNRNSIPFFPGGFVDLSFTEGTEQNAELDFDKDLLTVPPGLERGMLFKADGRTPLTEKDQESEQVVEAEPAEGKEEQIEDSKKEDQIVTNLMSMVRQEEDILGLWKDEIVVEENEESQKTEITIDTLEDEVEVVPQEDFIPVLKITETPSSNTLKAKWAEVLDVSVPVKDFERMIPNMVKTWDFELDNFQKQAILKLEERAHVFVAAHTSAGKTVVAEYAIALSQKHMTKAIYTSPIKALSNQKYRDFKDTFEDVGLITGDFQINQTAQCLIMTTEILRRMLYCGSEVVRDLEYVIFDEVHYINDTERGHVWEEVLILLPPHVVIVMLSATVPNTLEFADWVGRTKEKKVYVICTLKRPVPLEHFLYTSIGGKKQKDDCFLILDENSRFVEDGYYAAVSAKKSKEVFGQVMPQKKLAAYQERAMWIGVVNYLQQKQKLPVVAFTLSRNRCDTNSNNLDCVDLTTEQEKRVILSFVQSCVNTLKPPDQKLPQVIKLVDLLQRGIGVHHSGILPILKEIVEMLFQKSLVKLLFATETFAMGVNMPARTVVFDASKKFDGSGMRTLLPAEYIQMAGRAGRRGLDKTGTVIILCKTEVPPLMELKNMMLGKPTKLESKFRVTYSMILNLCRVGTITMENMMSHSFKQFAQLGPNKLKCQKLKAAEERLQANLKNLPKVKGAQWAEMCNFYDVALKHIEVWTDARNVILNRSRRDLFPGRVLLISHKEHVRKLGLLLTVNGYHKDTKYKVLVLCNSEAEKTANEEIELCVAEQQQPVKDEQDPLWFKMITLAKKDLFVPDGIGAHTVLEITAADIVSVTKSTLKVDCQLVYDDWDKRQMPRFKDAVPSQTCSTAVQMLTELTHSLSTSGDLNFVLHHDIQLDWDDFLVVHQLEQMLKLEKQLEEFSCVKLPNFEQLFEAVFTEKRLEEIKEEVDHMFSFRSLEQYQEFQSKISVLQSLKFIDFTNKIELKGRVACAMGNNELLLTEMVLENVLSDKTPAEIAALLSCLVFQQRTESRQELTESLDEGKKRISRIIAHIRETEIKHGVLPDESNEEFGKINFGLIRVIYDWAMGQPFASIMKITDVQEGVIVRCIQQLTEIIHDVKNAATTIGDSVLKQKMHDASEVIRRDIVFAASLYTSEETKTLKECFERLTVKTTSTQDDEETKVT